MFDYYQAPSDEIFDDMKRVAIHIRQTYDNEFWYVDEKVDRIKDIKNFKDNIWFIYNMFDSNNQQKVKFLVDINTRNLIMQYDDYNRGLLYPIGAKERYYSLEEMTQEVIRDEYIEHLIDIWYSRNVANNTDDGRDEDYDGIAIDSCERMYYDIRKKYLSDPNSVESPETKSDEKQSFDLIMKQYVHPMWEEWKDDNNWIIYMEHEYEILSNNCLSSVHIADIWLEWMDSWMCQCWNCKIKVRQHRYHKGAYIWDTSTHDYVFDCKEIQEVRDYIRDGKFFVRVIEKEEEPDTDTKCIPDYIVWKTYMDGEVVPCKNCWGDCTDKWTPKCPQTDTKWIDDAFNQYRDDMSTLHGSDYQWRDHYDTFEKAILSHIPR